MNSLLECRWTCWQGALWLVPWEVRICFWEKKFFVKSVLSFLFSWDSTWTPSEKGQFFLVSEKFKNCSLKTMYCHHRSALFTSFQAVGEPPLFLASSVFYAIKDAITFARWEFEKLQRFLGEVRAKEESCKNTSRVRVLFCFVLFCFFPNPYLGVWKSDETLFLVFDMLRVQCVSVYRCLPRT